MFSRLAAVFTLVTVSLSMAQEPRLGPLRFRITLAREAAASPVSGRLLAELMSGEAPLVDPAPFRAERFGR